MAPLSPASAFLLVVAALFSPLPQDSILLLIGASVAVNPAGAIPLTLAAWAGLLVKNGLIYAAGWALGGRLWSHRWVVARVSPARRAWVEALLDRYGPLAVFLSRFLPGVRAPTLLAMAARRGRLGPPLIAMAAGSAVQVLLLCALGGLAPEGQAGLVLGAQVGLALVLAIAGWALLRRAPPVGTG